MKGFLYVGTSILHARRVVGKMREKMNMEAILRATDTPSDEDGVQRERNFTELLT